MIVCPKLAYAAVFLIYCTTTIQCYKCLSYSFVYMIHYRSGNLLFLIFTQPKGHSCAELLEYWVDTGLVCFVFVPTKYKYKYKYKCKPSLILCVLYLLQIQIQILLLVQQQLSLRGRTQGLCVLEKNHPLPRFMHNIQALSPEAETLHFNCGPPPPPLQCPA